MNGIGPRRGAQVDGGATAITQLEVPGDEVGVEMGEEDVRDREAVVGRERDVLPDVPLRVHDRRRARRFVADQIRR